MRRHRIVIAAVAGLLSLPGALLAILVMYSQARVSMTLLILPVHGDVAGDVVYSVTTLLLYLLYLVGIITGLCSLLIDSSRRKASCLAASTIVGLIAAVFLDIRFRDSIPVPHYYLTWSATMWAIIATVNRVRALPAPKPVAGDRLG